jgi:hypothetical protein
MLRPPPPYDGRLLIWLAPDCRARESVPRLDGAVFEGDDHCPWLLRDSQPCDVCR